MQRLAYKIHEYLREVRAKGARNAAIKLPAEKENLYQSAKSYARMPQCVLPMPGELSGSLAGALKNRVSAQPKSESVRIAELSTLLHGALSAEKTGRRRHPSGGGRYPIETYVLARSVDGIPRGAYHYAPGAHSLERVGDLPGNLSELFPGESNFAWAASAPVIIALTGDWTRNEHYGDFGYALGLIEAGHMGQNILLAASALGLTACPMGGFIDDALVDILALDIEFEQPVYVIALG